MKLHASVLILGCSCLVGCASSPAPSDAQVGASVLGPQEAAVLPSRFTAGVRAILTLGEDRTTLWTKLQGARFIAVAHRGGTSVPVGEKRIELTPKPNGGAGGLRVNVPNYGSVIVPVPDGWYYRIWLEGHAQDTGVLDVYDIVLIVDNRAMHR